MFLICEKCPKCGKKISPEDEYCKECGANIKEQKEFEEEAVIIYPFL
ncbi:zinc ribbon domain-containing protein [Methanobrevibacter sp. OttesenSCG-928-K11]|nr:zinc ribbon domain-containing protein [Methanobrevibacter sp. OttesenSCG-928-K11]MDL2271359.1 zinc ribbon domain-containing protein [Methanobrevibacter sp. OttesenSCG-928-I08]